MTIYGPTIMPPEQIRTYWGLLSEQTREAYEDASVALRLAATRATSEILYQLEENNLSS